MMAPSQRAHWINKQATAVMTNKGHLIFLHTAFTDLWKQETQNQEPDIPLKPQQQTGAQFLIKTSWSLSAVRRSSQMSYS